MAPELQDELLLFCKQLLEVRYPGWAHKKGGGVFAWELAPDILTHTHGVELSNHDCQVKTLDGFADGTFQEIGPGRPQRKNDTLLATTTQPEPCHSRRDNNNSAGIRRRGFLF